jgi:hypothetical protein
MAFCTGFASKVKTLVGLEVRICSLKNRRVGLLYSLSKLLIPFRLPLFSARAIKIWVHFNRSLSTAWLVCLNNLPIRQNGGSFVKAINVKKRTAMLVTEDDLLTDLAFHNVPPSLLIEFSEKIVRSYYGGNLTAAIVEMMHKALTEQEMVSSHIHLDSENPNVKDDISIKLISS